MIGWIAYAVLVFPVTFLVLTGRLLGQSFLTIGVQMMGVALIIWARLAFGRRSFYAGSTPTAGGLVTSGPYRYIRHPIYSGVVWILVGAFVAHLDWQTCMAVLVAFAAISIRIMREEREVALRYPQYVEYRRNTYRIVPWIF